MAPSVIASVSLKSAPFTAEKSSVRGLPSLATRTSSSFNVVASGVKKIKTQKPLGIGGGMNLRDGVDASGRKVNQFQIKTCSKQNPSDYVSLKKPSLALHIGALLALAEQPALAVTGENYQPELTSTLIQLGIVLFLYFIVAPPIIMNWMRIRWYRRKFLEMYFQFMFTFIFFPGIILWAPFLNFRKFPRDPSLKYPWSVPEDPSKVRNAYSKYPFAKPEDYDP